MNLEENNELNDRLSGLSIGELLDVFASKTTPKKTKEQIRMFICENYEHTTQFQFLQSMKVIEESDFTEFHKKYMMNVKICARDIIQALDLAHVSYLPEVQKIILQKIEIAKNMS
jgi:hypothetical protein